MGVVAFDIKTDTASVLLEAMEYIQFLHEQVLSAPYLQSIPAAQLQLSEFDEEDKQIQEADEEYIDVEENQKKFETVLEEDQQINAGFQQRFDNTIQENVSAIDATDEELQQVLCQYWERFKWKESSAEVVERHGPMKNDQNFKNALKS
ncbi:hypothetical protein GH714_004710 [Hevea brasiliensis]|uniref:BHLH domain-containing protein n=1 Tax=Hevea brasiliensis TaxID=3981 RepID=A0A6A6N6Z9_HEVBR|nr:hypothetical protein GH714_004710 [Hevea brasiliensis]